MANYDVKTIPVSQITPSPFQPRESFEKQALEELAASMKSVDLLQPIVVRPHGRGFQIAAGERRWRAAQMAGMVEVIAIVKEMDDRTQQLYSIVENLHRLDFEPREKERAVSDLWAKHYEPAGRRRADLANDIGLDPSTVNKLIASYGDRQRLKKAATQKAVTTTDLEVTRGIDKPLREELLERKVKGEIAQKDLEDIASVAKDAPPEKQKVVVEELVRETRKSKELLEIAKEEAEEYARGELQRTEVRLGPDENRLRHMADLQRDVRGRFTVASIEMIENDAFRRKAVEILENIRSHADSVLRQLEGRDWIQG